MNRKPIGTTIKDRILTLFEDGQEYHYLVVSKKLKINPTSAMSIMYELKRKGILITPEVIITKTKPKHGVFKLKK